MAVRDIILLAWHDSLPHLTLLQSYHHFFFASSHGIVVSPVAISSLKVQAIEGCPS